MNITPKSNKHIRIMNVLDEQGRVVIPNAVYSVEERFSLIGVGTVPGNEDRFYKIRNNLWFGGIGNNPYILFMRGNPIINVNSTFATCINVNDATGDIIGTYKKLSFNDTLKGVEGTCSLYIPESHLVFIIPYIPKVNSSTAVYCFLAKRDDMKFNGEIFKVPLPNFYPDGKLCFGTGVSISQDELSPYKLMTEAIRSFDEDKYNSDLASSTELDYPFEQDDSGGFIATRQLSDCKRIANETLSKIISHIVI